MIMKIGKNLVVIFLSVILMAAVFTGCSNSEVNDNNNNEAKGASGNINGVTPQKGQTIATISIEGYGDVKAVLFGDIAPKAVENFTTHAKAGYYDGLTFHRVIADFMIQGGDPSGNGTGGESIWGKAFEDEFSENARNFTGALSMANSGPNTNGSQFFIVNTPGFSVPQDFVDAFKSQNVETTTEYKLEYINYIRAQYDYEAIEYTEAELKKYETEGGTPWLDNVHTVFGHVYEGLDVITKIMAEANPNPITGETESPVVIKSITISEYEE